MRPRSLKRRPEPTFSSSPRGPHAVNGLTSGTQDLIATYNPRTGHVPCEGLSFDTGVTDSGESLFAGAHCHRYPDMVRRVDAPQAPIGTTRGNIPHTSLYTILAWPRPQPPPILTSLCRRRLN